MGNKHVISAEARDVFGKKVRKFRRDGKVPGNIYGKTTEPTPVWFNAKELATLLKDVGESSLIEVKIGSDKTRPVIFRDLQHGLSFTNILHVDAQQVNLKEKIQVAVPVEITGESEAVTNGLGILETTTPEIEIEALPTDLPEAFVVDITALSEVGQKITVADLKVPNGVEILTDPETVVVAIVEQQVQEEEAAPVTEEQQVDGVAATEEKADGETDEKKEEESK
jgi:large subunit ribosomal protein L25